MLNKNRMMVFKNKGKDQEVSESLLPPLEEVIEFLARWKFFAGASRRSRIRRSAWCHSPPVSSPLETRACVHAFIRELLCLPLDFFLSLSLPHLSLLSPFIPLHLFFFFLSVSHISPITPLYPFSFFPSPSPLIFFPLNLSLVSSLVSLVAFIIYWVAYHFIIILKLLCNYVQSSWIIMTLRHHFH